MTWLDSYSMDLRSMNKPQNPDNVSERSWTTAEKTTERGHKEAGMMAAMAQEHLSRGNLLIHLQEISKGN